MTDPITNIYRALDDVVETLKTARERGRKSALIVGAGCSVKAGVPTASEFVKIIQGRYPRAYDRANPKNYSACMAELALAERRDLIADYVDKAKINWAHICIAQLMKHGFIDRILTTNFDNLLIRSCALTGLFPAVYDFASSQIFKPADIPDQSIFFLHGQRSGFVLLNTEGEIQKHSDLMRPVFEDAGKGRAWLVVGYSGNNDPVFHHLANVPRFDNKLYWVGYRDESPPSHVRMKLLVDGKYAFFTGGYDADSFLIRLTQELSCFPPDFVSKPFTHLNKLVEMLSPYPIPGRDADVDVTIEPRKWIQIAINTYEIPLWPDDQEQAAKRQPINVVALQKALMAGDYDRVIDMYEKNQDGFSADAIEPVCWAYVMRGNRLSQKATSQPHGEADRLFSQAHESFNSAEKIAPRRYEVLNDAGAAYYAQAQGKPRNLAKELFAKAVEKHRKAMQLDPNDPWTLNNLGNSLAAQATCTSGNESGVLFEEAIKQYQSALKIDPTKHEVLNSWGNALLERAQQLPRPERQHHFEMAGEKFQAALRINPEDYWTINKLAVTFFEQAQESVGDEREWLFKRALETFERAAQVNRERHLSLHNWGNALVSLAIQEGGDKGDHLFDVAQEIYRKALQIKPDYYWILNSWGFGLHQRGLTKGGKEAENLFAQAGSKYHGTLEINRNDHWALHNWGLALLHEATFKDVSEADRLLSLAEEKFQAALNIEPSDYWALYHWGQLLLHRAEAKSGDIAQQLFILAKRKFESADYIWPDSCANDLARVAALISSESDCRR